MTAREMQRRSAESRWGGLSAAERKIKMSALAKARWEKTVRKPKRAGRLPNAPDQRPGESPKTL
jgi:hypothetical protein